MLAPPVLEPVVSLGYARIQRRLWRDRAFRGLDPVDKAVAFYLLSGPSNRIGLFWFSRFECAAAVGIEVGDCGNRIERVCHTLSWGYHEPSDTVFVPTWWLDNPPENVKALVGYLKDLADVPNTPLISNFRDAERLIPEALRIPYRDGIDRVWHTKNPNPSLNPNPKQLLPDSTTVHEAEPREATGRSAIGGEQQAAEPSVAGPAAGQAATHGTRPAPAPARDPGDALEHGSPSLRSRFGDTPWRQCQARWPKIDVELVAMKLATEIDKAPDQYRNANLGKLLIGWCHNAHQRGTERLDSSSTHAAADAQRRYDTDRDAEYARWRDDEPAHASESER